MRPIPATMRDQTEFLPLGPPLRTRERPPVDVVKLERAEFEMYDASHDAPDAVWDMVLEAWVHHDHVTTVSVDDGFTIHADPRFHTSPQYEALRPGAVHEITEDVFLRAGQKLDAANKPQSPELTAALENAQRAMMAHFFGTCPQVDAVNANKPQGDPEERFSPFARFQREQRLAAAVIFGDAGRAREALLEDKERYSNATGEKTATGLMLLQEQANREMNKALRGRALGLSFAPSNPDRWNNDELRRKLGLGQIS